MNKIYLIVFLAFLSNNLFAQATKTKTTLLGKDYETNNYYELIKLQDNYWNNNPNKNNKGSGYKVYQRWKEYWQYYLNADSTLMTGEQIANEYLTQRNKTKFLSKNTDSLNNSNWIPLGPFTHENRGSWSAGQGRVNISIVDPNNPNTIYIGAPQGGVWRSFDNGDTWEILTDSTLISGASGIAIDYNNPNIIYVSTGDEDTGENPSNGIFKSIDGGKNWIQTSFPTNIAKTGEIIINPTNSNMLWVVSSNGIYKSVDAGNTWVRKFNFVCSEIRLKPNDFNTIYAVSRVGTNISIIKSIDAGETFTTIQSYTNAGRTMIDVTPANPNYLYVLVSDNDESFKGIYRSINSGGTFTTQNTTTDIYDRSTQSDFDLALAVSDTDPNLIYTGCLNVWKSTNGGITLTKVNNWSSPSSALYTHADIHDLKFFNGKLYAGSDGGIYVSNNTITSFTDKTKNGLNISQFYRVDVAQSKNVEIVGGLQDNGGYSFANNAWINYHGADGMDASINPTNLSEHYGFIQNGGSLYTLDISIPGNVGGFVASEPFGENGNWITPLEYGNNGTLYAGYSRLYAYDGGGFNMVSSQLFGSNIKFIRVHPTNDLKVLVSDESRLYISDGTENFNLTYLGSLPIGNLKNFDFNRNTPNIIYAMSNAGIYKSVDEGKKWQNITYNLPLGAKNALVHQASSFNNTVYVATNKAVYYINDSLTEWKLFSNNLPNTTITDIEVNNVENHLIISTYGRGIWRSAVATESLKVEEQIPQDSINSKSVVLFPNPIKDFANINTTIDEPLEIKVFAVNGQLVLNLKYPKIDNTVPIDFSHLADGNYVFNLISEKHLITKMFVKY